MGTYVSIAQTILAIVLTIVILLEVRGSSLGGFMSGGDSPVYRTRRGFERVLFNLTIVVSIVFFILSIWNVILSSQG